MKRSLGTIFAIAFLSLFLIYGIFEIANVIIGPTLHIDAPKDLETVSDPLLTISGGEERAAYLSVNDRQIFADGAGHFSDTLLLLPGYNIISVKVRDRFGKEISKQISIYYTPLN